MAPSSASLITGQGQSFTAQVQGSGAFSTSVTWSVNGVEGGNSTYGTITNGGQYTAPAIAPNPANVTVTATSVEDSTKSGNSTADIVAAAILNSIAPNVASAGEVLTVDLTLNGVIETPWAVFSGPNGTNVSAPLQMNIPVTVAVPFGATSGPVYLSVPPQPGSLITISQTSNSVPFSRLPNLKVHAANKDLSSGETLQFDWRLLGANTPSTVTWTADSGSVNAQGVFQAPTVTSESYSHVTGCISSTNSCNTVLLRILPFRITPAQPIVKVGDTLQLNAIQGASTLSAQWSILAGGGSITSGGLFTAPRAAAQAGPVIVLATVGSTTQQTSIAVSGAYAGQVNRVFDYADFTKYSPPEATHVQAVAVNGNRAYALTIGDPYLLNPVYAVLDVYDITNPAEPVWIDAVESATSYGAALFTYGNTLFSFDSNNFVLYTLQSQTPVLTQVLPSTQPFHWTQNGSILYTAPLDVNHPLGTTPVDLYDVSSGMALHTHYELPNPTSNSVGDTDAIAGSGNLVYMPGYDSILTYDVSQSPPQLISTVNTWSTVYDTSSVFSLHALGNFLFEESDIYDISNRTPVPVTTSPLPVEQGWGVQGADALVTFGWPAEGEPGYTVVDISSPSNPIVRATVTDLQSWDIYNPSTATWAGNGVFYSADGTGGFSVYDVSANGGPVSMNKTGIFGYIYDQAIEQQTLYAAAVYGSGDGGVGCFDLSQSPPAFLGALTYPHDSSFAIQVSGTNVFLGLADSLKVVDVSNPQSPVETASVAIPVNALALSGTTLFAGTGDGRLVVFDVSTPTSPTQIASMTMAAPSTMRLSGTLLLVAAGKSGLLIFDVSNASAPVMLSQFSPTVSAPIWDVASIGGSVIMLAADNSGIVTVDISDPSNPKQLYQQPLPYLTPFPDHYSVSGIVPAFSLATQNGLTYVGTTTGILLTFDASVPANPRLVAMNVVSNALDILAAVTPSSNTLFIADQGFLVQLDNSIPQNLMELYDPPAALSLASPIANGMRTYATKHQQVSSQRSVAHRQKVGLDVPDR